VVCLITQKSKQKTFVDDLSAKRLCSTKAPTTVALGPASSTGSALTAALVTVTASSQASRQLEVKLANLCYPIAQIPNHPKEHHIQKPLPTPANMGISYVGVRLHYCATQAAIATER
jgi:hypothetical protein